VKMKRIKGVIPKLRTGGFAMYIDDQRFLNCEMATLTKTTGFLDAETSKGVQEFSLEKASASLLGKPLYFFLNGITEALELVFDKERIVEDGYSSSEVYSRGHSQYKREMFKNLNASMKFIGIVFLLIIGTVILTYLMTSMYFKGR